MTYIRLLSFILIATLVMGCSKDEREEFKKELEELLMTKEEKRQKQIKEQRFRVINENARSAIQSEIIRQHKSYKSIDIDWVSIRDNYGYNSTYWSSQGYPTGYTADYAATIINEDFATITTTQIEGEITFWFKDSPKEELYYYKTHLSDWRVTSKNTQSTGRVENTIETIGSWFK